MLVSLMQKPDKRNRRLVQNLHIGFSVFEVNLTTCTIFGVELLTQLANNDILIFPFKVTDEVSNPFSGHTHHTLTSAAPLGSSH